MFCVVASYCSFFVFRLNTPLPSPGSVRNKKACYISQQVSTNPASTQFTPVPCTILSVHFDNGIHKPYYTISLDGEGREIQTEWHRLLVCEDGDDKTGYAAGEIDRVVGVSDALEFISNASTAASNDTSIPALLYNKVLETLSSHSARASNEFIDSVVAVSPSCAHS